MQDFKKLEVWKLSFELGKETYKETSTFPKEEIYGIISQLKRAALSISANIAEGTGKDSDKEFLRYLKISMGSLKETENFILMARDLSFLSQQNSQQLLNKTKTIGIKLNNFIKTIKDSIKKETQNKKLKKLNKSLQAKNPRDFLTSNQQARQSRNKQNPKDLNKQSHE